MRGRRHASPRPRTGAHTRDLMPNRGRRPAKDVERPAKAWQDAAQGSSRHSQTRCSGCSTTATRSRPTWPAGSSATDPHPPGRPRARRGVGDDLSRGRIVYLPGPVSPPRFSGRARRLPVTPRGCAAARCRLRSRSGCLGGRAHAAACAPLPRTTASWKVGEHMLAVNLSRREPKGRHVTNGVHLPSWVGAPTRRLLERHIGEAWWWQASQVAPGSLARWCPTPSSGPPGASSASSSCSSSRSAAGSTGSPSASRARGSKRPPGAFDPDVLTIESRGTPGRTKRIGRGCSRMKR